MMKVLVFIFFLLVWMVYWVGLELCIFVDCLIKECVDVDVWCWCFFGDIEMYIGGEEDDDIFFSLE